MSARLRHTAVKLRFLVACAALALAVTGCSSHARAGSGPTPAGAASDPAGIGVVRGRLLGVGGPVGAKTDPYVGQVRARAGGRTWTARTGADGRFILHLPPGSYLLTGRSPHYYALAGWPCRAVHRVRVDAGRSVALDVFCSRM
jgi:hypothetical protein